MRILLQRFVLVLLVVGAICLTASAESLTTVSFDGAEKPMMGANPIGGVPCYTWYNGCSPTSGGMMVGFWDGKPGFGNLYDGDASVASAGTQSMVASTAHITAGSENGYTYGDWHNSTSYPSHEANPDCIADFMKTVDGGSTSANIASGLEAYVEWDNPATTIDEGYFNATVTLDDVAAYGGTWTYGAFKAEIDAGRPVLLDVVTIPYDNGPLLGHSVVGYGYQDNMFQIKDPALGDVTVGGFAVKDTWQCPPGTSQSEWVGWSGNIVQDQIIGGVEWWPYIDYQGWSWVYSGTDHNGPFLYDWMIVEGITLDVSPIPEPSQVVMLLGLCAMGLVWYRHGRKKAS